ncbi:hypothetical protein AGMMS50268_34560 [Spirochaetia bacterium]|nr:hypothetical protein AGMMS50268_34560 [Spirochaetia bacterium]
MKKFFIKQFIYALIVGAALLIAACVNPFNQPDSPVMSTPSGTGMVRVSFSDGAARTIYPDKVFDHYVYTFTKVGASTGEVKTPDANGIFTLETGNWNLSVQAYADASNTSLAAVGSTAAAFTVSQNTLTDNIMITLSPAVSTGAGTLSYTIKYPDASVLQTLTFVQIGGGTSINLQTGASTSSIGGLTTLAGTKTAVNAGYYLVTAILKNSADPTLTAGRSEVVHIYNNLNTTVDLAFAAAAFTAAINAATPAIAPQPIGATYNQNAAAAALTVGASVNDGGNLTFQWYNNTSNSNSGGTAIPGETGVSYTPSTATPGTVYYYVIVTNTNNSVNGNTTTTAASNVAAVVVNPAAWGINLNVTGTHTFPGAPHGYSAQTPLGITITNTGNQATGSLTASLSGANSGSFSLSPTPTSISSIPVSGSAPNAFTVVPNNGLAIGSYDATVTVSGENSITANFSVSFTVSSIVVTGVTLNKTSLSLIVGATETLTAAVAPLNATNNAITWSSSNSGIASVAGGVVTAVAPGTATITVTTVDGLHTASATVTVPAPGTLAISIGFNYGAITITGSNGSNIISRGADTSKPTSLTLSATGYTGVQWYVDGVLKTGATGDSITLDAAAYDIRNHSVTFTGFKSGIPYSQLIPFRVVQ